MRIEIMKEKKTFKNSSEYEKSEIENALALLLEKLCFFSSFHVLPLYLSCNISLYISILKGFFSGHLLVVV